MPLTIGGEVSARKLSLRTHQLFPAYQAMKLLVRG
jgi:hypothetical protein